jgi:transmembrane protein EpsG
MLASLLVARRLHFIMAILCALAWMTQQMPQRRRGPLLNNQVANPLGYLITAGVLLLFSGTRYNFGDTYFYRHTYQLLLWSGNAGGPPTDWFHANGSFGLVQYWASRLGNGELVSPFGEEPGQKMILVFSALYLLPALWVLFRHGEGYAQAIYFFITTGTFVASMNGIRQYAAAGILLLGTRFLFEERRMLHGFLCYLPFIVFAWTMHSSALLMVPVFFLARFRAYSIWSYLILIGSAGSVLLSKFVMPGFYNALGGDYSVYGSEAWGAGGASLLRALVAVAPLAVAYFFREPLRAMLGKRWDILVNISFINAAIHILGLYDVIFVRLSIYVYIYHILLLCQVFHQLKQAGGGRQNLYTLAGYAAYYYYSTRANLMYPAYNNHFFKFFMEPVR